jgi:hypothetical protein
MYILGRDAFIYLDNAREVFVDLNLPYARFATILAAESVNVPLENHIYIFN